MNKGSKLVNDSMHGLELLLTDDDKEIRLKAIGLVLKNQRALLYAEEEAEEAEINKILFAVCKKTDEEKRTKVKKKA